MCVVYRSVDEVAPKHCREQSRPKELFTPLARQGQGLQARSELEPMRLPSFEAMLSLRGTLACASCADVGVTSLADPCLITSVCR